MVVAVLLMSFAWPGFPLLSIVCYADLASNVKQVQVSISILCVALCDCVSNVKFHKFARL